MFDNVGRKIKVLAKVFFGVGVALSFATWVVFIAYGANSENVVAMIFFGALVMAIGMFASWVINVMLYGFGILVETNEAVAAKSTIIAENTTPELKPEEPFDSFD